MSALDRPPRSASELTSRLTLPRKARSSRQSASDAAAASRPSAARNTLARPAVSWTIRPFSSMRRTMVLTVLLVQPALSFSARTSSIRVFGPAHRHSITRHSLGESTLRFSSIFEFLLMVYWLTVVSLL